MDADFLRTCQSVCRTSCSRPSFSAISANISRHFFTRFFLITREEDNIGGALVSDVISAAMPLLHVVDVLHADLFIPRL